MNDSHPRLKNLIVTETQKERIESKNAKVNSKKVAIRRAIEDHQEMIRSRGLYVSA